MSDVYEAATEIRGPLQLIEVSIERIWKSIDAAAQAGQLPRREALAREIYLRMIDTVMTMHPIPAPPASMERPGLARAAWELADHLLAAELLAGRPGPAAADINDDDTFDLNEDPAMLEKIARDNQWTIREGGRDDPPS